MENAPFWRDRPEDRPDLDWVLRAFWELNSTRPVGTAPGSIPFTAIDRYAERFSIDEFDEFLTLIRALDSAYLEHFQRK